MADLVSGGVVGALVGEVFIAVKKAVETINLFADRLESIKSFLKYLEKPIEQMKSSNDELDISNEELTLIHDLLTQGLTLMIRCQKITKWNPYDKHRYSKKLLNWDSSLQRFCTLTLPVITARDVKAIRVQNTEVQQQLSVMQRSMVDKDVGGKSKTILEFKSCNVPQGPDFVVGLDVLFKNIKEKLLNGKEQVIIISGAGGYGKSTLVKKLCQDDKVTGEFKDMIFVVISESPNLILIVQTIINHFGGKVPETHSEDDAIQQLKQLLAERGKQNSILLVLDDIWSGSETILEKFVYKDVPNYKVLVTSRFKFPGFGRPNKLNGLEHKHAVELLRHAATALVGPNTLPKMRL